MNQDEKSKEAHSSDCQPPSTIPPGNGDGQNCLNDAIETAVHGTKSENRKKKVFECDHCGKKFGQKGNLNKHISIAHDPEVEKYCPGPCPPKRVKPPLETFEEFQERMKVEWAKLGDTFSLITYFRCPICEEKFEHEELNEYQTHINQYCPKRFGSHLIEHNYSTVHEKKKEFACDHCDKKFGHRGHLNQHISMVHEKKKDFACDQCDKKFGQRGHLNQHISSVHEKNKPFACNHCGKKFGHRGQLNLHISTVHEKKKEFACDHCDKKFGQKNNLNKHISTVHGLNVQKNLSSLIKKKEFACEKCGKKFGQKSDLTKHISHVHEKKKEFACDRCGKKFGQKVNLNKHISTVHEKKKEFECDHCGKKFGQKGNLDKHISIAHDPEVEKYCPGPCPPKRVKPPLETFEEF